MQHFGGTCNSIEDVAEQSAACPPTSQRERAATRAACTDQRERHLAQTVDKVLRVKRGVAYAVKDWAGVQTHDRLAQDLRDNPAGAMEALAASQKADAALLRRVDAHTRFRRDPRPAVPSLRAGVRRGARREVRARSSGSGSPPSDGDPPEEPPGELWPGFGPEDRPRPIAFAVARFVADLDPFAADDESLADVERAA